MSPISLAFILAICTSAATGLQYCDYSFASYCPNGYQCCTPVLTCCPINYYCCNYGRSCCSYFRGLSKPIPSNAALSNTTGTSH